ncbi:MAG: hypothetical protein RBR15_16585 [Sphaerochaeta sp.]|nr:hypothetical protein [Sphaerochaeta sp.]
MHRPRSSLWWGIRYRSRFCHCYGVDVTARLKEVTYHCGNDVHIVGPQEVKAFWKEGEHHFAAGATLSVHKDQYAAIQTDYIPLAPSMPLEG